MYQEHERDLEGKTVTHATVKKLLAAFAVTLFTDVLTEGGCG